MHVLTVGKITTMSIHVGGEALLHATYVAARDISRNIAPIIMIIMSLLKIITRS